MSWPVTINGHTYQLTDFSPYSYAVSFPAIIDDVAVVAGQVETNKTAAAASAATATTKAADAATSKSGADTAATAAAASQLAAGTSATNAATSETNAVAAAAQIAALKATSTTSLTIAASGDFTATIQSGKSFVPGMQIFAASAADPTGRNMTMIVKSYSGTSLVATAIAATGAGNTAADWNIFALGAVTLQGVATDPATFAIDRFRNQLDDWRALLVPERPSLFQRFTDSTYFARDRITSADYLKFLAGAGGSFARASGGTLLNVDGALLPFLADVPCITDRGLLLGGGDTNLSLYSEDFTNVYWMKSNSSITPAAKAAPDGTQSASKLVEAASGSTHLMYHSATGAAISAGGIYTFAVFVKSGERTRGRLSIDDSARATKVSADFDLTAGTITSAVQISGSGSTNMSSGIKNVRNGWFLAWVSAQIDNVSTIARGNVYILDNSGNLSFTGDGSSGLYVWGAQVVPGGFPTSYIKTTTAAATRAADNLVRTRVSPTALSKLIRGRTSLGAVNTGVQVAWQIDDGTANNRIILSRSSARTLNLALVSGGATTLNLSLGTVADDTPFAVALRAADNNIAASLNGGAVVTSTSVALPAGLVNDRLGRSASGSFWNGMIEADPEFPNLLSNDKLQTLAT